MKPRILEKAVQTPLFSPLTRLGGMPVVVETHREEREERGVCRALLERDFISVLFSYK